MVGNVLQSGEWVRACAEHDEVVAAFAQAVRRVPDAAWHARAAAGVWTPAELALHVSVSYQFGVRAARGGAGMRLRAPRVAAWFARTVLLPRMLAAQRFPAGARSPGEVVPNAAEAAGLSVSDAVAQLERDAAEALAALQHAAEHTPRVRVVHAYFGALPPLQALRLLSAHTRHHAGHFGRWGADPMVALA